MGRIKDELIDKMNETGPEEYPDYRSAEFEQALSDDVCSMCDGTGEVDTMDIVYPGEPHTAPVGSRACECKIE